MEKDKFREVISSFPHVAQPGREEPGSEPRAVLVHEAQMVTWREQRGAGFLESKPC